MAKHEAVTTDAEIEAALASARLHDRDPVAQAVEHIPNLNLLIVRLSNERRLVLPIEDLQGLDGATHEQLQNYELLGRGTGISFPALDATCMFQHSSRACTETAVGWRNWAGKAAQPGPRPNAGRHNRMAPRAEGQGNPSQPSPEWRRLDRQL